MAASGQRRALVVGGEGVIGRALAVALETDGWLVTTTSRRGEGSAFRLDLAAPDAAQMPLPEVDVAVFCAAISRFADCAANPDLARRVNLIAPLSIAERLASMGTHVVLLSTSAVFNGEEPRVPADQPVSPTTVYGRLKAEAESGFLALGDSAAVLRLTRILYPEMALFAGWIEGLRRGDAIGAFSDLTLAPIPLRRAVAALTAIASANAAGIYQASALGDVTYVAAARHVATRLGVPVDRVVAEKAAERGIPAEQRPRFSSLETSRLDAILGSASRYPFDAIDEAFGAAVRSVTTGA